ncbi:GlxA family transcriptional regulator [Phyllobacterium sophorae]|uniref:GlxA family transcriptional regulator n=1 Tax=Phyllobacterium sophorae TaxID=1520277 RepID=A0A2P7BER8_9HYPH|nr:GlxA family transcriptional regulator [Phyllobacterium sophorae]PSH64976.1 GlxA family transcriptional regulator [Phyllobacterium sophorae]
MEGLKSKGISAGTKSVKFGIVLLPNFTLSALSLFLDCLRLAADEKDQSRQIRCRWEITTLTGDSVRSSSGMVVETTAGISSVLDCDYVIVVGGLIMPKRQPPVALLELLDKANKRGVSVIGLCTGSFVLVESGILPEKQCCVSWLHKQEFDDEYFDYRSDTTSLYRANGNHYTCAGGVGSAYLALEVIGSEFDEELARKCASILMIPYERRKSEQPAPAVSEISNKVIRQTIRVFETTMEDPPSLSEVARRVGITSRQLERIFRDELGTSPSRIRDKLRVQRAKQLLVETDLNFTEVAVACGLFGTRTLNRTFEREGEKLPREIRSRTA